MDKQTAINLLGGSISSAAKRIGVSYSAVRKWPPILSPRIADRVEAALAREAREAAKTAEQAGQPALATDGS